MPSFNSRVPNPPTHAQASANCQRERFVISLCRRAQRRSNSAVALALLLSLAAYVNAEPATGAANSNPTSQARPQQRPTASQSAVRSVVGSSSLDDLRWPDISDFRSDADAFYRRAGYTLAWSRDGKATTRAREMIDVLLQADGEGLNSEDYDGPRWAERLTHLAGPHIPADEARFDVALTICAMRYLSAVRVGRINPKHLQFGLDVEHKKLDLPHFLRQILADSTDLNSELAEIEPPFKRYKATRTALLRYMELAKQDDGERLPPPPGMVFRGGPYDGIARLARLLRLVGDLPQEAAIPADSKIYDEPLVTAVKRFQERHGLRPNGYLTVDTVEQMNVPLSSRVVQIRLTLERYRWLPYTFSQPPIVVNLPEFRLYAFDRDGRVGLAMKVNVGDAYDFQTPVFENSIRYLVFRPYWNVPPKILRNEVIPDTADDRSYVKDNHMEVTTPGGQVVASGVISDTVLQQLRAGKLTVRQKPGPDNALGTAQDHFPQRASRLPPRHAGGWRLVL